jgi:uncharacterized protein involved in exopolysaccharide biosynthesis
VEGRRDEPSGSLQLQPPDVRPPSFDEVWRDVNRNGAAHPADGQPAPAPAAVASAPPVAAGEPPMITTRAVTWVVITAVVFAVVAYVIGSLQAPQYSVAAQVLVQPDPTINNSSTTFDSLDQSNIYVQSQVAAIQSQSRAGLHGAAISVTQVGLTNVLAIGATAGSVHNAVAAANTMLARYVAARRRDVRSYASRATAQIDSQLSTDATSLKALSGDSPDATAERNALGNDYSQLVQLKHQVTLNTSTAQPTQIVHQAAPADATVTSSKTRDAFLAGIVGALLAAVVVLRRRRRAAGSPAT